jgi:hypothetical protein
MTLVGSVGYETVGRMHVAKTVPAPPWSGTMDAGVLSNKNPDKMMPELSHISQLGRNYLKSKSFFVSTYVPACNR